MRNIKTRQRGNLSFAGPWTRTNTGPFFTSWSDVMWYRADFGPSIGLLMFEDSMRRIDILAGFDDKAPVGTASRLGSDAAGLAVWQLNVRGADLGGRWIVIDRQFVPAP